MHISQVIALSALMLACAHAQPAPAPTPAPQPAAIAPLGTLSAADAPTTPRPEEPATPEANALHETKADAHVVADTTGHVPGPSAPGPSKSEAELRERVQKTLLGKSSLSYAAQRVQVLVDSGDVTLRGEVRNAHEKSEVQGIVQRIVGVRRVQNELSVVSGADQTPTPNLP